MGRFPGRNDGGASTETERCQSFHPESAQPGGLTNIRGFDGLLLDDSRYLSVERACGS